MSYETPKDTAEIPRFRMGAADCILEVRAATGREAYLAADGLLAALTRWDRVWVEPGGKGKYKIHICRGVIQGIG